MSAGLEGKLFSKTGNLPTNGMEFAFLLSLGNASLDVDSSDGRFYGFSLRCLAY